MQEERRSNLKTSLPLAMTFYVNLFNTSTIVFILLIHAISCGNTIPIIFSHSLGNSTMRKEDVLKMVLESPSLPTLPTVAYKLISISSKEEIGMKDIADLISKDASLSAKVLKIANSALYNLPCKISTIHQAASRLGMNAIRNHTLSFSFYP